MNDKGQGIIPKIQNLIKRHYKPIWRECDREAAFELCNKIRERTDCPPYDKRKFDEGWQYRTIFHEDYSIAKDEFFNLVFGWW